MKKKKTTTTIKIHQVSILRPVESQPLIYCPECPPGEAAMIAPEQAAIVAAIPVRQVYRLVEAGTIHYVEEADGSVLTCLRSLHGIGNRGDKG